MGRFVSGRRVAPLLIVALLVMPLLAVAAARERDDTSDPALQREIDELHDAVGEARAQARSAARTAEASAERAAHLEARLERLAGTGAALREQRSELLDKIRKAVGRLWDELESVRGEADAAAGDAGAAASSASDAAARAARLANELSLLTERYDYHLRRYHGGG